MDNSSTHHLIIAGTGRSGTSALVKLLSACGLETSLSPQFSGSKWSDRAHAGAETHILARGPHPYVIKSPWSYQFIEQLLDDPRFRIDEVIIPIRRLKAAAASRIVNELGTLRERVSEIDEYNRPWSDVSFTAGGAITSLEPIDQERALGRSFHLLVESLEERQVAYRFLNFPRFAIDPDYTFSRLGHLFSHMTRQDFDAAFASTMDPDLVRIEEEMLSLSKPDDLALNALRMIEIGRNLSQTAICADPDHAPQGLSYGDAILTTDLGGWHYLTSYRQDPGFGFQVAFADTGNAILYRFRAEGKWHPWMTVALTP